MTEVTFNDSFGQQQTLEYDAFISHLNSSGTISSFHLEASNLDIQQITAITDIVIEKTVEASVFIEGARVGDAFADIVANFITNNTSTEMDFPNNDITDVGAITISNALANFNASYLGLSSNKIGDIGAAALINSMPIYSNLGLSHNMITNTEETASNLEESIKNTKLLGLFINNNNISYNSLIALADALAENNYIQNADFNNSVDTQFEEDVITKFIEVFENHFSLLDFPFQLSSMYSRWSPIIQNRQRTNESLVQAINDDNLSLLQTTLGNKTDYGIVAGTADDVGTLLNYMILKNRPAMVSWFLSRAPEVSPTYNYGFYDGEMYITKSPLEFAQSNERTEIISLLTDYINMDPLPTTEPTTTEPDVTTLLPTTTEPDVTTPSPEEVATAEKTTLGNIEDGSTTITSTALSLTDDTTTSFFEANTRQSLISTNVDNFTISSVNSNFTNKFDFTRPEAEVIDFEPEDNESDAPLIAGIIMGGLVLIACVIAAAYYAINRKPDKDDENQHNSSSLEGNSTTGLNTNQKSNTYEDLKLIPKNDSEYGQLELKPEGDGYGVFEGASDSKNQYTQAPIKEGTQNYLSLLQQPDGDSDGLPPTGQYDAFESNLET